MLHTGTSRDLLSFKGELPCIRHDSKVPPTQLYSLYLLSLTATIQEGVAVQGRGGRTDWTGLLFTLLLGHALGDVTFPSATGGQYLPAD